MTIPAALIVWANGVEEQGATQSVVPLQPSYATVDTPVVPPNIYSLLPPGTALESGVPESNRTAVFVAPPYQDWEPPASEWHSGRNLVTWSLEISSHRSYSIGASGTRELFSVSRAAAALPWIKDVRILKGRHNWRIRVSVVITLGMNEVQGLTGARVAVQDCSPSIGNQGNQRELFAHGGPGRVRAFALRSQDGVACVFAALDPHPGAVRVALYSRVSSGGSPQMCLYQIAARDCLGITTLPASSGWVRTDEVVPVSSPAAMYLYANAQLARMPTTSEYAEVNVSALIDFPPQLVLIGTPKEQ